MLNKLIAVAGSIVAIVVIGVFVIGANKGGGGVQSAASTPTPDTIHQAIAEVASGKALLVDVRTPSEYAAGHAKGAANFDVTRLQAGEMPTIAKTAKVYLYCHTGRRAGTAQGILQQKGWNDVTNLGGFSAWQSADGPTEG